MILAYLAGNRDAGLTVSSSCMETDAMTGRLMCRTLVEMNRLEQTALALCRGRVLDLGAGSGCHSLALQDRGLDVTAVDISPGCVAAMKQRGVKQVIHASFFDMAPRRYDTLLMLMNGIGICGSLDGLNLFFQHAPSFLAPGGQILADSTDLSVFCDCPTDSCAAGDDPEGFNGEADFVLTYGTLQSPPFNWLYIDFPTLAFYADLHHLACDLIRMEQNGKYLVRIRHIPVPAPASGNRP